MPETERKLVLHSPASSEYVEYRWPLTRTVSLAGHKAFRERRERGDEAWRS